MWAFSAIAACFPVSTASPQAAVIERLSLLKYRNARGSHIYIRPSGEHRYTALDDLSEISLNRLIADGFTPCAVVETSAGNFQAWLKHPVVFPKLLGTFAAQTLAARYDADPSAADWRRFGRLPGFTNCKPKYKKPDGLYPFVRLKSHSGEQYPKAESLRGRDHEALRSTRTGARGKTPAGFSFSPKGTEVIEPVTRALPHLEQVPGPPRSSRHRLLRCRVRQWHERSA